MSDNPADSIRRELEVLQSKLASAITNTLFERDFQKAAPYVFHAVWPLITAALEAARADERERLRGLTRCICGPDSTGEAPNLRPDCPQHGVDAGTNRWPTEAPF